MDYETVATKIDGIPHMTREQGRIVYDHIRSTRPASVLEIGTANGVGTAYMAAALDEIGEGRVTTVDRIAAGYDPGPEKVLADVGLADRVDLIRVPDSSYNWWLKTQILAQSDAAGNTEPMYEFVYLDGAHEWNIDGLAVVLIEKLLKPGGWLLLDDLDWTYATSPSFIASPEALPENLSEAEFREPHIRAVFDVLLKSHPAFSEFRDDNGWAWAKKDPGAPRRLTLVTQTTTRSLSIAQLVRAALEPRLRRLRGRRRSAA
jgi:predicted O-methyltransferase YrrM